MKYKIEERLLTAPSKRRSGAKLLGVKFIVAHDTGNPGSTALQNVSYYENSRNQMSASAHFFVDDKQIICCIPENEKAWHVLYEKRTDNLLFGFNANDAALGIELCFGGSINNLEAYKRYVWLLAHLCKKYKLNPTTHIVGHHILDPERKTDPVNALKTFGKTYEQLLADVLKEYNESFKASGDAVASVKPTTSATTTQLLMQTLKKGDKGEVVKKLQTLLNKWMNANLKIDGDFGVATEAIVKAFQMKRNLVADGVVGQKTWEKLV